MRRVGVTLFKLNNPLSSHCIIKIEQKENTSKAEKVQIKSSDNSDNGMDNNNNK